MKIDARSFAVVALFTTVCIAGATIENHESFPEEASSPEVDEIIEALKLIQQQLEEMAERLRLSIAAGFEDSQESP